MEIQEILENAVPTAAYDWLLPTKLVAEGFGVSPETVRGHKLNHADELIEGHHWFTDKKSTFWTKAGVVRLGMFIKSARAAAFRDAAESHLVGASGALVGAFKVSTDALKPLARAVAEEMFTKEFPGLVQQEYTKLLTDREAVSTNLGKLGFSLPKNWQFN